MIAARKIAPMESVLLLVGVIAIEGSLVSISGHLGQTLIKSDLNPLIWYNKGWLAVCLHGF